VQAPLVGRADWFPLVRENTGRAGVFAPPDIGFPDDGVVAESANDGPGWLFSDLDLGAVRSLRDRGEVGNYNDWNSQHPAASAAVETVTLGAGASAGG
jgi:predicted amidohydrolase